MIWLVNILVIALIVIDVKLYVDVQELKQDVEKWKFIKGSH